MKDMEAQMRIILASNSPRRSEILRQINVEFEVIPSNFEEAAVAMEPSKMVEHFAYMKAMDVYSKLKEDNLEDTYIIGSDTIVFCETIMGKPKSKEDAYRMLKTLSGKEHEVISGLCVIEGVTGRAVAKHEITKVWMRELEDREIFSYIDSGEPNGKAGAYAIQGIGALLVERLQGCYFNVVGLPVNLLFKIMKEFGVNLI
jgi:septum formation protein